jgi:hypothetical protein
MSRPARRAWALLAGAMIAGCGPAAPPAWHEEDGYRWRELEVPRGNPGFTTMVPSRTRIRF